MMNFMHSVAQDAVIGHEAMHARHDDPGFGAVLTMLEKETMDASDKEVEDAQALYRRYCRFKEIRADVKSTDYCP